jgi:hypothetical protein
MACLTGWPPARPFAVTGKHGESEATLWQVRHMFVNRANMRSALR